MSKQETLIDKLEQRKQDFEPRFASDFWILEGLDKAINIVKEHNEWISTNERLPYAEEILTNHYDPKEFYEIILKTGELLIASYTHMKNDGINEILFMDCTIVLTDGHWELLDAGFDGYQTDEVAYWKPIKPPSEVQDES